MKLIKLIKSTFYNEAQTKRELISFIKGAKILSFSKQCEKFEKSFSEYQGSSECIFVNSGSSANLAIVQALLNLGRIKRGDKVGFSALTWSTNVMPLIQLGLKPVPIDVELGTLNISSSTLISKVKSLKTPIKMLFITNLLGFCDDIDKIKTYCKKNKIILIEDNCESLGSVYKGTKLGNFGLASTFSFYVGHHMSTIEGGAVCTNDKELANMLRLVRAHGWDRNLSAYHQKRMRELFKVNSTFYSRYTFYDLGFNLRPTELAGFLGNNQLRYIDEIIEKRNKFFMLVAPALYSQTDRFYPVRFDHMDFVSNFAVPIICKTIKIRDEIVKKCARKLEIRPVVGGDMTMQPFFEKMYQKNGSIKKSNSSIIHQQGLYFGNNPEMTNAEAKYIIKILS